MPQQLSKKEIKRKAENIDKIYKDCLVKLADFKKQQNAIIEEFIKKIEQKRIEEIDRSLDG